MFKKNIILEKKNCSNKEIIKFINKFHIGFKVLSPKEKKQEISKIYYELKNKKFSKTNDKNRKNIWNKSWSRPAKFKNFFVPTYAQKINFFRICGKLIYTESQFLEQRISQYLLKYIFKKYVNKKLNICEFGAGSGKNIIFLKKQKLVKNLYASDWVDSAVRLIKKNGKLNNLQIKSFKFNIKEPNHDIDFVKNNIVMTHHALEQVYNKYKKFINLLIRKKPQIIVHVEPIFENYDKNNDLDKSAIKFHKQRNYLNGLKTYLNNLSDKKKIKILKDKRFYFGTKYHEGYSLIIWRTIN